MQAAAVHKICFAFIFRPIIFGIKYYDDYYLFFFHSHLNAKVIFSIKFTDKWHSIADWGFQKSLRRITNILKLPSYLYRINHSWRTTLTSNTNLFFVRYFICQLSERWFLLLFFFFLLSLFALWFIINCHSFVRSVRQFCENRRAWFKNSSNNFFVFLHSSERCAREHTIFLHSICSKYFRRAECEKNFPRMLKRNRKQ